MSTCSLLPCSNGPTTPSTRSQIDRYNVPANSELRRIRLKAPINEASELLPINEPTVLTSLELDEGYWLAHDEGGVSTNASQSMVSIVGRTGDEWLVRPVKLTSADDLARPVTDAEALASHGGWVFVVGSGFVGANNKIDQRRSFISRFSPSRLDIKAKELVGEAETLDLGTTLLAAINNALARASVELIEPSSSVQKAATKAVGKGARLINIEGAACSGSSLLLGLRWPTSVAGRPVMIEIVDGAHVLTSPWNADTPAELAAAEMHIHEVAVADASAKKPLGVRALFIDHVGGLHAISGPTDRDMAAAKLKAGAYSHVSIDLEAGTTQLIETFEGYRKVEALSERPVGGWLYGLDDEKAIVLLLSDV